MNKTEELELQIKIMANTINTLEKTIELLKHSESSSIPKPPEPPLSRIIKEGGGHFCKNCGSTSSKVGFIGLFGEILCDNKKCPNSKSRKNYQRSGICVCCF